MLTTPPISCTYQQRLIHTALWVSVDCSLADFFSRCCHYHVKWLMYPLCHNFFLGASHQHVCIHVTWLMVCNQPTANKNDSEQKAETNRHKCFSPRLSSATFLFFYQKVHTDRPLLTY